MGFARRRPRHGRRPLYRAGERPEHGLQRLAVGGRGRLDRLSAAGDALPRRARASRTRRRAARSAARVRTKSRPPIEPLIDKAAKAARDRSRRDSPRQRARQRGEDRLDAGRRHERLSEGCARSRRRAVQLGRARARAAVNATARRCVPSASARRFTPPAVTVSTASCASRPTASSTSIPASATSARTRTPPRRASRPKC